MLSNEVLVVTTSNIAPLEISKYVKPISAHIVVGTNFFSDFLGGLTDVFGGKSATYQKKLAGLYNEAIVVLQNRAKEAGANCIVGLSIDVDEISGKGKSMFMITAIGTAVVIEKQKSATVSESERTYSSEFLSYDFIQTKIKEKQFLEKAEAGSLTFDDETWDFIISNKIEKMFPYIIAHYSDVIGNKSTMPEAFTKFDLNFQSFVNCLDEEKRHILIYQAIQANYSQNLKNYLVSVIKKLSLFNFKNVQDLLKSEDFKIQKIGLRVAICDKPFYNRSDIDEFELLKMLIEKSFLPRGEISVKKQLLTSKEKEVWNCECGNKNNEIDDYCSSCNLDIYGFYQSETKPNNALRLIDEKIAVICTFIK
ncbi:hypothetical protein CHX27_10305 [Flavobacterium aurantiibacter]|uniref:Uncharacterized protein n=2 Tax=Flavobacterium aurantiibacter TaxID=2023067 RepID=A0A255ZPN6_9FLAO|nr:hypothetical protein CHX27_10305 [Flavobacterium aurantiibacter]